MIRHRSALRLNDIFHRNIRFGGQAFEQRLVAISARAGDLQVFNAYGKFAQRKMQHVACRQIISRSGTQLGPLDVGGTNLSSLRAHGLLTQNRPNALRFGAANNRPGPRPAGYLPQRPYCEDICKLCLERSTKPPARKVQWSTDARERGTRLARPPPLAHALRAAGKQKCNSQSARKRASPSQLHSSGSVRTFPAARP